jgi:GNAT superfamily N-acetyltransferase
MSALDERVRLAHGDAWQAEGRLRANAGGGAAEWPGVRLMSSGLRHAQWNNGDLVDLTRFDLAAVRDWYAARANGAGVPWGMRVPAGTSFPHGRFLFAKRNMALVPAQFVAANTPANVALVPATPNDVEIVATIDAAAFDEPVEQNLPWVGPHLGVRGFTVAIARSDGEPVGVATAVHTDDRAGRCVGIFGVGVLERARGRGIGAALTAWLVGRAFDDGATLAHLNPNTEAAARVYARLGFAETPGFDIYVDL